MNSYCFAVNVLFSICVITVGGKKLEEIKDELVPEIFHFMNAEAYTPMDKSLKEFLNTNLDFNDREGTEKYLREKDVLRLESIVDHQVKCIHCTVALAAKHMIERFTGFVERTNNEQKCETHLVHFVNVASASAIVWRKAISAVVSIKVEPGQWLWHMLIFTNTLRQVTRKSYPGMTIPISNNAVYEWVTHVLKQLGRYLVRVGEGCRPKNVDVWDFRMPPDDATPYDEDVFKAGTVPCPKTDGDLAELCELLTYIENFDKYLFRNQRKRIFSYGKHEAYDPDRWLVTYPTLKGIIDEGPKTDFDWNPVVTDLDTHVKPISKRYWVLNYTDQYFETVDNMSEVVRRTALHVLRQTHVVCRSYWRSVKIVFGPAESPFDFKTECTGVRPVIGKIMEKYNLQTNETFRTLYRLSGKIYTLAAVYHVIIRFIDRDLGSHTDYDYDPRAAGVINSYRKEIENYSEKLPVIYTDEFALFKKSFYAKTRYITTTEDHEYRSNVDVARDRPHREWSIEIESG